MTAYRLLIAALVTLISSPALASVAGGDTLEIHGQRIRLSGIDAPESSQLCRGDDSLQYRCGAKAANGLDAHVAGRPVSCEGVGRDQYGRIVAVCLIEGEDIATWPVRNVLAFDWPRYSNGKYAGAQKEAGRAGRGAWVGSYVVPWAYRACIRNGGPPAGCSMMLTRNRRRPAFKCGAPTSGKNWRRGQLSYKPGLLRQSSLQGAYKEELIFTTARLKKPGSSQKKIRVLSIIDAQFLPILSYMTNDLNCAQPSSSGKEQRYESAYPRQAR